MSKEIEIPEGCEARIDGNKVIFELKESEDERIREAIEGAIRVYGKTQGEWIGGYDMDTLVVHLREAFGALEKQKEQRPAEWSEKDEGMLNCIIATLCEESHGGREANDKMVTWLENRLKFLRPQPKQEWSEEEERHLYNAIEAVKYVYDISEGTNGFKCVEFLKSFRPQPHWKPSEEQIIALKVVARGFPTDDSDAIDSLLHDLKKLM